MLGANGRWPPARPAVVAANRTECGCRQPCREPGTAGGSSPHGTVGTKHEDRRSRPSASGSLLGL